MKIVIAIFCLPQEIDRLEATLLQLRKASVFLESKSQYIIDVALGTSKDLTDWSNSVLTRDFFVQKFLTISNLADWAGARDFEVTESIKGCIDQRRATWKKYPQATHFIWLDPDVIFAESTLLHFENAIREIDGKKVTDKYVVTSELVKIWDETWDIIVNKAFLEKPIDYHKTNDPFVDCGVKGEISVEEVFNSAPLEPPMKFAGGWFTCISKKLLDRIGLPDYLGHYGPEDSFLMEAAMRIKTEIFKQYKIKNLIVCENYKYNNNRYLTDLIKTIDRKNEYKAEALANIFKELDSIK